MAVLTWKNVEGNNTSAADAYAKFSELFTKAGEGFSTGLDTFQNTRKEQAAMAVQRLLQEKTSPDQLKDGAAVRDMLSGIPQELLTPEVFAQIEGRRTALRDQGKYDSDLENQSLRNDLTRAQTDVTKDGLTTSKLSREKIQQDIALGAKELASYDRLSQANIDKIIADTLATKAGIENDKSKLSLDSRRLGLEEKELNHSISIKDAELDLAKLDTATKEQTAALVQTIGTTKNYAEAKSLVENAQLPASAKMYAYQALTGRFGAEYASENRTGLQEAQISAVSGDSPFAPLSSLRVKTSKGETSTFGDLGVTGIKDIAAKGGDHFKGGEPSQGVVLGTQLLANTLGDRFGRITAFDDEWHRKNSPTSGHIKGKAFDFTVKGDKEEYAAAAKEARASFSKQGLVEGKDFHLKDEANFPSDKATEAHIHVKLTDEGTKKLAAIAKQYEANDLRLPETLTTEISKLNANVPSISGVMQQVLDATEASLGMKPVKVPEGQDANDPVSLGKAIAAELGLPEQNAARYTRDIKKTLASEHSKGNTSITPNQIASAYRDATTKQQGVFGTLSNFGWGYTDAEVNASQVENALKRSQDTDQVEGQNLLVKQKEQLQDYKASVDTLNKLNEQLQQEILIKGQGANNDSVIAKLRDSIATQAKTVSTKEDRVRAFIEAIRKKDKKEIPNSEYIAP